MQRSLASESKKKNFRSQISFVSGVHRKMSLAFFIVIIIMIVGLFLMRGSALYKNLTGNINNILNLKWVLPGGDILEHHIPGQRGM